MATTLTDSGADWTPNFWAGGTIWLHELQAAYKVISNTATTVTFAGTVTDPLIGKPYSLANKDYPLDVLRSAVNSALRELRADVQTDDLVSVCDQQAYTLPNPGALKVEVQDVYDNNDYQVHQHWREEGGVLKFDNGFAVERDGLTIRVTSRAPIANLTLDADEIPANVSTELLAWKSATHALRFGLQMYGQDPQKHVTELMQEAQQQVIKFGGNRERLRKTTRLAGW